MTHPARDREQLWTAVRSTTATGLHRLADVLSAASKVAQTAARQLNPPPREEARPADAGGGPVDVGPGPVGPVTEDEAFGGPDVGTVEETPPPADLAEPATPPMPRSADATSREPASRIVELADRNSRDVIAAVGELSTDELRQLYEYESSHKRRKTVLAAIDRAAEQHAGD